MKRNAGLFVLIVSGFLLASCPAPFQPIPEPDVVATPRIAPAGGTFTTPVQVVISCTTSGSGIFYTLDGSDPTESSLHCTGPLTFESSCVVRARAFLTGYEPSAMAEAAFTIQLPMAGTPVIDPAGGAYAGPQTVTITSPDSGAQIRYTADGSEPSLSSPLYTLPFSVAETCTVRARSFLYAYAPSAIAEASFTVGLSTLPAPEIDPPEGSYSSALTVTLSCAQADAELRYTTNGDEPTEASALYTAPFAVSSTSTVRARAFLSGRNPSPIAQAVLTIELLDAALPVFSLPGGTYNNLFSVALSSATETASVYYTTDGTEATEASTLYASPIPMTSSCTVRARAFKAGLDPSAEAQAVYTLAAAVPSLTLDGGTYTSIQSVSCSSSTSSASLYYTMDGSEPTPFSTPYSGAIEIGASCQLRVRAFRSGFVPSAIAQADYTINLPTVATPVISPAGGTYANATTVSISCTTPSVAIFYTTDGTEPTTSSLPYGVSFSVNASCTVRTRAYRTGYNSSAISQETFTLVAATPVISPAEGTYSNDRVVSMSCATTDASIYYTINGLDPTPLSTPYAGSFSVNASCTIRARAFLTGYSYSGIASSTFAFVVADPESVPAAGTYYDVQSVTLSCLTSSSAIRYTTDGSEPTASSDLYSGAFPVAASCTVRARAFRPGYTASGISQIAYTIDLASVAVPVIGPAGGTYNNDQTVGMSCTTGGATIRYTLDGSDPIATSAEYTESFAVSTSRTVRARAFLDGRAPSGVAEAVYVMTTGTPGLSPTTGTYTAIQTVTLSCATSGASVYYTTDGSAPTATSTPYTAPFEVAASCTVRARAFRAAYNDSAIAQAVYTINLPTVATPTANYTTGIYYNDITVALACSTPGASIYYTTDGVTPTTASTLYSGPFVVSAYCTMRARAFCYGYAMSSVIFPTYQMSVAMPALSYSNGTYNNDFSVTVTCSTTGASIYYTMDGSDATTSSTPYTGPVPITATCSPRFRAFRTGYTESYMIVPTYTMTTATPTVTPAAGTYANDQTVTMSTATTGAAIRYTTDGSDPTALSTLYSGPFALSASCSLRARAFKTGYNDSAITARAYTMTVATLTVTPAAGTYTNDQTVTMSTATTGAAIRYTTDGSDPTTASTLYTGTIALSTSTSFRARAFKPGYNDSVINFTTYTLTAATPSISPTGSAYSNDITVSLACSTTGATVYYTTDGTDPTTASTPYSAPFAVNASCSVRARAFRSGYNDSAISARTYTLTVATPSISPNGGSFSTIQTVSLSSATSGTLFYYTTDGTAPTAASTPYTAPFEVSLTCTVRVRGIRAGYSDSAVALASFNMSVPVVATPSITPSAGTYVNDLTVGMSCATSGATIYYTTDGSDPTTGSTAYGGSFTVASSCTVKARAFLSGSAPSAIASRSYTMTILNPWFSYSSGTYANDINETIQCGTSGVEIRYTMDGNDPTSSSTLYSGPIAIGSSCTLRARAFRAGYADSAIASATYTMTAGTPGFDYGAGTYNDAIAVQMFSATSGVSIYYTTDGSDPTALSTPYSGAITVNTSCTVRAIAYRSGYSTSSIGSAAYQLVVASPYPSSWGGTYGNPFNNSLFCGTTGAAIHYTTDGSAPTEASTLYTAPFAVETACTIRAKAYRSGFQASGEYSGVYTFAAATPTVTPSAGTYVSIQTVTMSCATSGAIVYYTMDGSDPTTSSIAYTASFQISASCTIRARAFRTGFDPSAIVQRIYTINLPAAATPSITPSGGTYTTYQTIGMSCGTSGASIYYTTDGSDPTTSSSLYSTPFQIETSCTIRARAYKTGNSPSAIASRTYTIDLTDVAAVVFSKTSGSYDTDQLLTLTCSTSGAAIFFTMDGSDPTTASTPYSEPILINTSRVVRARAFLSGYDPSPIIGRTYTMRPSTPTFSSASGTYSNDRTISISCSTSGATLHYTTDGSTPTEASPVYSGSFLVQSACTVQAIAYLTPYDPSLIGSRTYLFKSATPTISPAGGAFSNDQGTSIYCTTSGSALYYTTDGSEPTILSTLYSGSFTVNGSCTVQARAYRSGYDPSDIGSASFALTCATPVINPAAGTYTSYQTIALTCATSSVSFYYTTDGSDPTTLSTLYLGAFPIDASCTVRAIAVRTGYNASSIAQAAYSISLQTLETPTITPASDSYNFDPYVTMTCPTPGVTLRYTTDGSAPTESSLLYGGPFSITSSCTLRARAYHFGYIQSGIAEVAYTVTRDSYLSPRLAGGSRHSLFVDGTGAVWSFGYGFYGQLGDGGTGQRTSPYKILASGAIAVAAGTNFSMYLLANGTVWTFGQNDYGQLGIGSATPTYRSTPGQILSDVVSIYAGYEFAFAIKSDGTVWAWGRNDQGQLGDGTRTTRLAPTQIPVTGIRSISCGFLHTTFVTTDDVLLACGDNYYSQLGDGTSTDRLSPVIVMNGVVESAASEYHTYARLTNGSLSSWGYTQYAQNGGADSTPNAVFAIATGGCHSLIVRTDGTLWAVGRNFAGQLGTGSVTTVEYSPVQIMTGVVPANRVVAIGASLPRVSDEHTLVLVSDGTVFGFGYNDFGQLGLGYTSTTQPAPSPIAFP